MMQQSTFPGNASQKHAPSCLPDAAEMHLQKLSAILSEAIQQVTPLRRVQVVRTHILTATYSNCCRKGKSPPAALAQS